MAGHSHAANIKHRKNAQDAKRAKIFTRAQREVYSATKNGGENPDFNPRLRLAISKAKALNVPKDKIEGAIQRATTQGAGGGYEEITYVAHLPGGVALAIDAITDNRNRCIAEVRSVITKYGGSMGETSGISFLFIRYGMFLYKTLDIPSADAILEATLDNMPEDVGTVKIESEDDDQVIVQFYKILCKDSDFAKIRDTLMEKFGDPEIARLLWHPNTTIQVDKESKQKVHDAIRALEEFDDVDEVYTNIK